MAVIQNFKGKSYIEPRVQVSIEAGVKKDATDQYGKILLIDAGEGAGFGLGKGAVGIGGTNAIATSSIAFASGHNFNNATKTLTVTKTINGTPSAPFTVTFNTNLTSAALIAGFFNTNRTGTSISMAASGSNLVLSQTSVDDSFILSGDTSFFGYSATPYLPVAANTTGSVNFLNGYEFDIPKTLTVKETVLGVLVTTNVVFNTYYQTPGDIANYANTILTSVRMFVTHDGYLRLIQSLNPVKSTTNFELTGTDTTFFGFTNAVYSPSVASATSSNTFASGNDFTNGSVTMSVYETVNGVQSDTNTVTYTGNTYPTSQSIADHFNANSGMQTLFMIVNTDNTLSIKQVSISSTTSFTLAGTLANLGFNAKTYTSTITKTNRGIDEFLYTFLNQGTLEAAMKGGRIWSLADYFYHPDINYNTVGANTIYFAQARETASAFLKISYNTTKFLTLYTKDEGLCANWDETNYKGYAAKIIAGTEDTSKFRITFYQYDYKGVDENGVKYKQGTLPTITELFQSNEFFSVSKFIEWASASELFLSYFGIDLDKSSPIQTSLTTNDISIGYLGFAGAVESYTTNALTNILRNVTQLDYSFMFSTNYGSNGASDMNLMMLSHILNERITKNVTLHIGGYDTATLRGDKNSKSGLTSAGISYSLDSSYATVYHGGDYKKDKQIGLAKLNALYTAACCVGRRAGLRAQDSLTYKTVRSIKLQDLITNVTDRENLIQLGVCFLTPVINKGNVIDLDINTLRGDNNLVDQTNDENGELISYHNDLMQIKNELQRLFINIFTATFIGTKASEYPTSMVKENTIDFFKSVQNAGLILEFKKETVEAVKKGTATFVSGKYLANSDNTHLFASFTQNV